MSLYDNMHMRIKHAFRHIGISEKAPVYFQNRQHQLIIFQDNTPPKKTQLIQNLTENY